VYSFRFEVVLNTNNTSVGGIHLLSQCRPTPLLQNLSKTPTTQQPPLLPTETRRNRHSCSVLVRLVQSPSSIERACATDLATHSDFLIHTSFIDIGLFSDHAFLSENLLRSTSSGRPATGAHSMSCVCINSKYGRWLWDLQPSLK
jgi:hypothetical protein